MQRLFFFFKKKVQWKGQKRVRKERALVVGFSWHGTGILNVIVVEG